MRLFKRASFFAGVLGGFFALLLFSADDVFSQEKKSSAESVTGVVTDTSGKGIAKANLSLINAQQSVFGSTESDADGRFSFSDIPSGSYAVLATKPDFGSRRVAVQVNDGATANVTIELEINPLTDQVTVTADTGVVQDKDGIAQQVNVVPKEAIRQRVTAVLAQAANEEAGVALQRTSPTIAAIFVRGLTGKNVATYVDGVRFTTSTGRGGINTFFDLNEPTGFRAVEILRGPNSAQYGSDSLGGTVQLVSVVPNFGGDRPDFHGEIETYFNYADLSFGGNSILSYGRRQFGILTNLASRRVNTLRPANGIDGHSAVTRFLGLPSDIFGDRLPDTAFTQYSGSVHINYAPAVANQLIFHYQRSQQDGGKRYDQLIGGDGNLVADLRNLMLDFFYARYDSQSIGFFDNASFTFSYNAQREERVNQGGQGNPLGTITSQYERTNVFGFNFHLDKQVSKSNTFLLGADVYRERVKAPAFSFSPASGSVTPSRPRVPNQARYITYGFYAQDILDLIPNRVRLSSALRFGVASYESKSSNSPIVRGNRLFPDDSLRTDEFSGRAGIVVTPVRNFSINFNYSRGFRAPNITDLGTLGLTGDGFEVASTDIAGLGGTVGASAGETAVSTGIPVQKQRSEVSNNYDLGIKVHSNRFDANLTGFIIDINGAITKQALILPPGSVGRFLGDQPIIRQLPNGVVFVSLSPAPVLVRSNFSDARIFGFEHTLDAKITNSVFFGGNFTYIRAKDKATGRAPNIEGGTPPPTAFLRLRYAPPAKRYWVEVYSTLAADQERLSSLDLSDRRTGATRSRTSIAAFFNNGARVRGLIGAGPDGRFGTADDLLLPTGETLAQVQNRVLGSANSAPLFPEIPGYGLINLRGGVKIGENSELFIDFKNIADKSYRGLSWGIDGPGRSVTLRYRYQY